ncbi:B2 bradykinin receptor-like [Kryptolebias marmoratus]|uniref:B2 bradykinin receptor-like n=1 Tax=Kryptolebias marmoratus TaxID=37003 RepID=UPI0007F9343E|nr:B2 bradykinin receptor-like [Kryptolebias marmoratus]
MHPYTTSAPGNTTFETGIQNETNASICINKDLNWKLTFVPVYILLISVLGIVLNAFVLMVFCLQKKSCTTPEIYLSNLAAADLLLAFFRIFWAIYILNEYNWTFGRAMCKVVHASILMNAYCSIYFVVLVSIDRYLALVHPLSYERIRSPFLAKRGCLLVWILGFIFCVPQLMYRDVTLHSCNTNYPNIPTHLTIATTTSVFGFIIPFFVISFCTLKIFKALKSKLEVGVNTRKTDQKAPTLVLTVLLAFLICWIPYHLVRIPSTLREVKILTGCNLFKILNICGQISAYFAMFNCVLNPILYIIVGKNFREKVKQFFRQWNPKKNGPTSSHYDEPNC